jgi:hypothetical protein
MLPVSQESTRACTPITSSSQVCCRGIELLFSIFLTMNNSMPHCREIDKPCGMRRYYALVWACIEELSRSANYPNRIVPQEEGPPRQHRGLCDLQRRAEATAHGGINMTPD